MKAKFIVISSICFLLLGIMTGFFYNTKARDQQGLSFTLEQKERLVALDTRANNERILIRAFRADGSYAWRGYTSDREPTVAVVTLVPQNQEVSMDFRSGLKSSYYLNRPPLPFKTDGDCTKKLQDGMAVVRTGNFMGYPIVVIRGNVAGGPGHTGNAESWLAPDFGCQAVYHRVDWTLPDGRIAQVLEKTTINLSLGNPDPAIFEIPKNLVESPPSQRIQNAAIAKKADEKYLRSRADKPNTAPFGMEKSK